MTTDRTRVTQQRYDRQASLYDLKELPMELLGFGRLRKILWQSVKPGRLLEIGVGTGKNLQHHPDGARVIAIDISPRMLQRAAVKAGRQGRGIDLVLADAQNLPFRDGSFDGAAATFVFCSVPDPVAGLEEARRVVKAGGRIDLLEHVRARFPAAGWVMDRLNPLVVRMMGANINRDTVGNVGRAGIDIAVVESGGLGIIKLIRGCHGAISTPAAEPEERGATSHVS